MLLSCPDCGADLGPDETCRDRFDLIQLEELAQPSYYAAHYLSVLCYMLQHDAYSLQGWLTARGLLFDFVHRGLRPVAALSANRARFDGGHRSRSLTRGPKLPGVTDILWSRSIADVQLDSAEAYCADVRLWAESILLDSAHLVAAQHQ
jgi:hypothetical protein